MKSTLCRAYLNVFDATLDSTFALGLRLTSPAVLSGEDRGLISRAAAGNRALSDALSVLCT